MSNARRWLTNRIVSDYLRDRGDLPKGGVMDVTDVLVAAVIATAVTVLVGDWLEDRR